MHVFLVPLYPFLLHPFLEGYGRREKYCKGQQWWSERLQLLPQEKRSPQCCPRRGHAQCLFQVHCQRHCRGQKHQDLKEFTSEILRYVKGKVTSDQTRFCLKLWWIDRDEKWKKYVTASCTLSVSISCWLLSEAGICSGDLVPHTSFFHALIKMH